MGRFPGIRYEYELKTWSMLRFVPPLQHDHSVLFVVSKITRPIAVTIRQTIRLIKKMTMNKEFILSIFAFILTTGSIFAQSFDKKSIASDLEFLRQSLEQTHYDLYAYTTEQAFDAVYQEVKGSIAQDSLSLLEATSLFQRLISAVNNGHTEISFPGQSYAEYAYAGGTVFPLEIAFEDGKALVRKNWSANNDIKAGAEVLAINGMPMAEILSSMYPQISAERPYFKNTKIELYSFPRLYWQVFGRQDDFEVEIRSNGKIEPYSLKAVSVIEGYEMKRNEVLNAAMQLKFYDQSAYLNPGNFAGDEKEYQQFIDSAFTTIQARNSKNLIIDLRNNGGGDDAFSDYLVSYIANKPFKWNSSFTLKTSALLKAHVRQNYDTTLVYWRNVLSHEDGEIYDYTFEVYEPQPTQKRFTGDVYVLVNRQSHSQSAVTAAQIQDYQFGTIVGEETGDYPSLYASQFQYKLPNTGIPVKVSKGYIVRVNGSTAAQGVMPDIFIKDHLLDENDEILEGMLAKISEKY